MKTRVLLLTFAVGLFQLLSCKDDDMPPNAGIDPDTAPKASIDRFSDTAGNLFVRDGSNGFPQANMPVDFDQEPFITQGLSASGDIVRYYNFDVQPAVSAPIFVLFREGESTPVPNQLNIIDVIPETPDTTISGMLTGSLYLISWLPSTLIPEKMAEDLLQVL